MATEPFIGHFPEKKILMDTEEETLMMEKEEDTTSISEGRKRVVGIMKGTAVKTRNSANKPKKNVFETKKRKIKDIHTKSIVIINAASSLDGCDDQLLPASFRALEIDLAFHPSMLGLITLMQTMCLSLFSPIWGYLSDRHSRKFMLACGTITWGTVTVGLGLVSQFWQVMVLRGLNGLALGSVGPISQSILADVSNKSNRGFTFGLVQLVSCIGRLIGGVITTSVALLDAGALRGWRVCFICVGGLSILLGIIILIFLEEIPRRKRVSRRIMDDSGGTGSIATEYPEDDWFSFSKQIITSSLTRPSVIIVILEGLFGTIPWSAFSFNTMFFQYCNMSDIQAAVITGSLLVGAGLGGILGGMLGDCMYIWSAAHGRPMIGQLAMLGRVPLLILAYIVIPKTKMYFWAFLFLAFFVGLSCMAGVAVNRPILADVVRPDHRGTVFAITVASEGTVAALFGAPLVGILAERVFGYIRTDKVVIDMEESLRIGNANALAYALVLLTVIPWFISFILYGGLHFTYHKDQEEIRELILKEYHHDDEDEAETDCEVDHPPSPTFNSELR